MSKLYTHLTIVVVLLLFTLFHSHAQINTPRGSQMATVNQTVGTSTIEITYSRPSVNGREIWGSLVPYGLNNLGFGTSTAAPWRAGANENTIITFSDDVQVEGKPVEAGTYALFLNVQEGEKANLILNKKNTAWGSFFYEAKDDVVNVEITTKTIPHTEMLTFGFPEVTATSATAALMWEKRSFPFTIEVPVTDIVLRDIRNSMENQSGFNRQTWEQAAAYAANNGGDLNEALGWIDAAIAGQFFSQKTFANVQIKAGILNQMGRQQEALALVEENMDLGTILEIHQYGRQLIAIGMKDQAMEVFQFNADKNKDTWPVHYGMARGLSAKGDYKNALKHLEKALVNAPNEASKGRVAANIDKLKNGEDIN
ncbi:DUF2911 domain-containing protein [Aureitalea marina]|uniref:Uncharacterized protein n=1 Tax=Aureitalea marina TaxID=930804 RepID=A0A2S7KN74_9FLAO|nr:DUF2911 domain-containing protein [Aureitalea marina]PQB04061.1 hypothetical protein BST85_03455 [Aureitalea marina]